MLFIFEKIPVQYRAPLYAAVEAQESGLLNVVYETEGAVSTTSDKEFGGSFAWDIPLLKGYAYSILDSRTCKRWKQLWQLMSHDRYQAILLTGFDSWICKTAFFMALALGKPIWIRMETQDHAFSRSPVKEKFRSIFYRIVYSPISKALHIGVLNREHYLKHGFHDTQLKQVPYIVCNPLSDLTAADKQRRRAELREKLGIKEHARVIAFFGKFIPKKQPDLLLQAHEYLSQIEQQQVHYLFVGSGELEAALKEKAETLACPATFTGFINQSQIHDYYLASDIMCLPSRQMGETWGLTVNEGLQAGCAIICSEHVGSSVEFGKWERVEICKSEDPISFASCVSLLMQFEHDFDWCEGKMEARYSMKAAASAYRQAIRTWTSIEASRLPAI